MSSIWTGRFWQATAERSIKTQAQTAAAMLTASGVGILDADWQQVTSVSLMAGLISVLTSVGSDAVTGGGPSITNTETIQEIP